MRKLLWFGLFILVLSAIIGCDSGNKKSTDNSGAVSLTISAAASLKDAAEELKKIYLKQHPSVTIIYNFGASGTLQKQIEEGAPVDLFISAGKSQMDALAEKGLILDASRKDLLGNELVLITRNNNNLTGFEGLTDGGVVKISIGMPETVPAGKYAQETLTSLNLWDKIQPKLVLAKDVRQVLTYVETGNVDAGLIYRSDAITGKDIKIVATAPAGSHKTITYPMAVVKSTKHQEEIEAFTVFLCSDEASKIFEKYGFKSLKK